LLAAGCINQPHAHPSVPDQLRVTAAEVPMMTVHARGVQIYECRARANDAAAMEWGFIAPEANLFDANGQEVGKHYAGPTWRSFDGSRVVGTVKASAVAPRPGAIPWLWLTTRSTSLDGVLAIVTSVQRINTVGGAAPDAAGCTPESKGRQHRVLYTADYVLFKAK
jgi:hypothetical protein